MLEVKSMPSQNQSFDLDSRFVGALPIANHFLARLQVEALLEHPLPPPDPRSKVTPARVLMVLLRSLIVRRIPLYSISEWASSMLPAVLGLHSEEASVLNDDRIGRALDELFQSDRQTLLTHFVLGMIHEFQVRLDELHNDSTSLTFQGDYTDADGRKIGAQPTHRITYGHNKDCRPDLKQLLWILTVSSDGAVPVHFKVDDGNIGDPTTHIETWNVLRQLVGGPRFLYVADCKLCTSDNLRYIDGQHGSFITVLPSNRKEDGWFREWLCKHDAPWQMITCIAHPGQKDPDIIQALESPIPEVNGFRLIWFLSSRKCHRDAEKRQDAITRAIKELEKLKDKLDKPRCRTHTLRAVRKTVDEILTRTQTAGWIDYTAERTQQITEVQQDRKRPTAPLRVQRRCRWKLSLTWQTRPDAVRADSKSDGILPLVINRPDLSPLEVYIIYHCNQPLVEKRHDLLKNTLQVTPAFLHSISRLEAFLFLEYLAVTVHALVERELRLKMHLNHLDQIPLYPEERQCSAPTAERVFEIFEHVQMHTLLVEGKKTRTFPPPLTKLQLELLELLGIAPANYTDY
jgi:transposase